MTGPRPAILSVASPADRRGEQLFEIQIERRELGPWWLGGVHINPSLFVFPNSGRFFPRKIGKISSEPWFAQNCLNRYGPSSFPSNSGRRHGAKGGRQKEFDHLFSFLVTSWSHFLTLLSLFRLLVFASLLLPDSFCGLFAHILGGDDFLENCWWGSFKQQGRGWNFLESFWFIFLILSLFLYHFSYWLQNRGRFRSADALP